MFKVKLVSGMLLVCLGVRAYAADEVAPYEEYEKKIKASQVVGPLKGEIFGENVSLYDRSVSFRATDVEVPGNNALPVAIGREFKVMNRHQEYVAKGFGDWEIDTPRVYGEFSAERGWVTTSSSPTARCSIPSRPDAAMTVNGTTYLGTADNVWNGYYLHVPGAGEQELLVDNQTKTPRPTDGATRPWITKDGWRLGCLASVTNYAGEGFLAISPAGFKYYFDYAVATPIKPYSVPFQGAGNVVARTRIALMASRIEDRFGNWVTYSYSGDKLSSVQSSDGRAIALSYNGDLISNIQVNGRTWTYSYEFSTAYPTSQGAYRLKTVTQPDGSQWIYSIASGSMLPTREPPAGGGAKKCISEPDPMNGAVSLQITHPSGAVGLFAFGYERQYRTHTPIHPCDYVGRATPTPYVPGYLDNYALGSKTITGPGLAQQTWLYLADSPRNSNFYTSGQATDPCPTCVPSKAVKVVNPDGFATSYEFGFMYGLNDGRLLSTTALDANGNAVSKTSNTYFADSDVAAQPFPAEMGQSLLGIPNPLTNVLRPLRSKTVVQDGASYTWTANGFDAFARTLSVTRASPWNSRTDATEYYDDLGKWIVGQSAKNTNSDTGLVESQISYDANAMPSQRWSFGKLRLTLGYNGDGTLATVKDGNNNTTTVSSWKRGLPQSIRYADGSTESATVNDSGWITATTDENGYTTTYGYDAMGRMASIAYPANDSVAWNSTARAFEQVNFSEYGLAAGHWRQTVATGNGRKVTYFDALWRPIFTREFDAGNEAGTQRFQKFAYDHDGRATFASYPGASDALSAGTWTSYDALGRTTAVAQDSELGRITTRIEYLANNQTRVTNPRGSQTVTGYQVFDQPSYDAPVWIQHPEGATTEIARDVLGKPTSIRRRDAGGGVSLTRSYVYDGHQQLCKTIEPETGVTATGYDAAGNLVWNAGGLSLPGTTSCDADAAFASGRRIDRSYDARNRIAALVFPDGNGNQRWTYWPDGLVKQITTTNNGIAAYNSYAYNRRRLLIAESQGQADGETWAIGYGYNANGHLAAHRYPSGQTIGYAPNALGQPTQAGTYATGVSYYPNGAIRQFTYGNGIVHTLTQNARQLPDTSQDAYGGAAFLSDGYDYDANGNVAAISDGATGRDQRGNRTMAYDGLDRLTSTVSPMFGTATYRYDVLDNLTHVVAPGRDHDYCYDPYWQLTNIKTGGCGGSTVIGMSYDVQGNLSNKNGQGFVFDYGNRLRQAAGKETYRYDGNGRRTLATQSGGAIGSMYDQAGALRYQKNQREGKATDYILLGGSLVAESDWAFGQTAPVKDEVNWTAVGGVTRYVVEESVDGVTWTSVYDGAQASWTSLARPSGTYTYRVLACTADGACSAASNVAHRQRPVFDIVPMLYQLLLN